MSHRPRSLEDYFVLAIMGIISLPFLAAGVGGLVRVGKWAQHHWHTRMGHHAHNPHQAIEPAIWHRYQVPHTHHATPDWAQSPLRSTEHEALP